MTTRYSAEQLLAQATCFSWDCTPSNVFDGDRGSRSIDLVRMRQEDGSHLWAIRKDGRADIAWTSARTWELEGLPSGRTGSFLARGRWHLAEALEQVAMLVEEYTAHLFARTAMLRERDGGDDEAAQ